MKLYIMYVRVQRVLSHTPEWSTDAVHLSYIYVDFAVALVGFACSSSAMTRLLRLTAPAAAHTKLMVFVVKFIAKNSSDKMVQL